MRSGIRMPALAHTDWRVVHEARLAHVGEDAVLIPAVGQRVAEKRKRQAARRVSWRGSDLDCRCGRRDKTIVVPCVDDDLDCLPRIFGIRCPAPASQLRPALGGISLKRIVLRHYAVEHILVVDVAFQSRRGIKPFRNEERRRRRCG